MINSIILVFGISILLFFLFFSLLSLFENENLASKRAIICGIITSAPFFLISQLQFTLKNEIEITIITILSIIFLLLLIPINRSSKLYQEVPKMKIDERDIMFSRNELEKGTEMFKNYYKNNPYKLTLDEEFRNHPGLLDENSLFHDNIMAASTKSSFEVVELLIPGITGKVSYKKEDLDKAKITNYIKEWTKKLGAIDIGITELKDYHLYSVAGRKGNYGNEIINRHKFAIAFTVEMDYEMVKGGPSFPIVMESAQQYFNAGQIAVQVATLIRKLGYDARAHIDGNYQVVCPLVAKDAGLGEVGRMGLLMTEKLGPRVRVGVVTTDINLDIDNQSNTSSVIDFCNKCKKCADCCPSSAIQTDDRKEIDGVFRWKINSEACFTYWCKVGSDCGRFIAVCPYSHPNNFLHNGIRWGIKRNPLFRKLALWSDDFFYGKKPKPNRLPEWISEINK